jgi:hypothetical protein
MSNLATARVSLAAIVLLAASSGHAQEGHPLVGSWHGTHGPNAKSRTDITVVMDYDGQKITGTVNPGFENMELQNAQLTPKGWLVRFEIDSKTPAGKTVRCVVDGKIDRLGSDRRTITGAWVCGGVKHDFELTRDRDYYR